MTEIPLHPVSESEQEQFNSLFDQAGIARLFADMGASADGLQAQASMGSLRIDGKKVTGNIILGDDNTTDGTQSSGLHMTPMTLESTQKPPLSTRAEQKISKPATMVYVPQETDGVHTTVTKDRPFGFMLLNGAHPFDITVASNQPTAVVLAGDVTSVHIKSQEPVVLVLLGDCESMNIASPHVTVVNYGHLEELTGGKQAEHVTFYQANRFKTPQMNLQNANGFRPLGFTAI